MTLQARITLLATRIATEFKSVRTAIAAGAYTGPKITVSSTAPSSPATGDIWIDVS